MPSRQAELERARDIFRNVEFIGKALALLLTRIAPALRSGLEISVPVSACVVDEA